MLAIVVGGRAVRTGEGGVGVEPSGKGDGGGAYLCARPSCGEKALKSGRLAAALRVTLSEHDRDALRSYASRLEAAAAVGS